MMSRVMKALCLLLGLLLVASPAAAQTAYKPEEGTCKVDVLDETWRDDARAADGSRVQPESGGATGREVPIRAYIPRPAKAATDDGAEAPAELFPVVVFSHGMGGTPTSYEYIARHLASHGYLVILPQHAGSDLDAIMKAGKEKAAARGSEGLRGLRALRERRKQAKEDAEAGGKGTTRGAALMELTDENTSDPANLENRPRDVSFVLDQVTTHPRLSKIADTTRVAVAGHSFGSYTTMAVCGMRVDLPSRSDTSFRDERVRCGIAMSPQGRGVMGVDDGAWDSIDVPVMIMTGTKDMGQGDRAVTWRHEPYDRLKNPESYFLNITDANHMTFSGGSRLRQSESINPDHLAIVKQTATAFLDAQLKNDAAATAWLHDKSIVGSSHNGCTLDSKGVASDAKGG